MNMREDLVMGRTSIGLAEETVCSLVVAEADGTLNASCLVSFFRLGELVMRNTLWMASVVFLACSAVSFAAPVSIGDQSFEDAGLAAGGWSNTLSGGWTNPGSAGQSFVEYISGFSADGTHHLGIQDGGLVYQDVGSFQPNTVYTLTLNIGNRNNDWAEATNASTWEIQDTLGLVYATASLDALTIAQGTFSGDQWIEYTTPVSGGPTGAIRIALSTTGSGRAHWDNVRLDATLVPEPSTLALLVLGGGSLMMGRRRRRR